MVTVIFGCRHRADIAQETQAPQCPTCGDTRVRAIVRPTLTIRAAGSLGVKGPLVRAQEG